MNTSHQNTESPDCIRDESPEILELRARIEDTKADLARMTALAFRALAASVRSQDITNAALSEVLGIFSEQLTGKESDR